MYGGRKVANMDLRQALGMLSKSSPYAVSTAGAEIGNELASVKQYLYVKTDIEQAFEEKLKNIEADEIVFLCGSSGDGKSEILTRYRDKYAGEVDFHLDATHSFEPDMTAVETLNSVFAKFKSSNKGLVVGINIGMLGNYAREGADEHAAIKESIHSFLEAEEARGKYSFIDFESFSKFNIASGEVCSDFFSTLLSKIVSDCEHNPYEKYLQEAITQRNDPLLVSNIRQLRDSGVQKTVICLLLTARIRKDQFITARMLLDFIYCILTGPGFLFDNLFNGGDNELLEALSYFDPGVLRNKKLDLFVIHRKLQIQDDDFSKFSEELDQRFDIKGVSDARSLVRCLYLFKDTDFKHGYIDEYQDAFDESAFHTYKGIWELHKAYDDSPELKEQLKRFYSKIVFASINMYANRNATYLAKDQFYISSHGDCDLAADIELSVSYKDIGLDTDRDISGFKLHLAVNDEPLEQVSMNVNLLEMMMRVVAGFRPNKHDKNSVVLLDEIVNKITEIANASSILFLYKDRSESPIKVRESQDGEIRVSGF